MWVDPIYVSQLIEVEESVPETMLHMADFWLQVANASMFVSAMWAIPGMCISYIRQDWMHVVELASSADAWWMQGSMSSSVSTICPE